VLPLELVTQGGGDMCGHNTNEATGSSQIYPLSPITYIKPKNSP
jgi:hypothetical protein